MGDDTEVPVLRRKAGARRAAMGLAEMTASKAMRLALARAGDRTLGVPVALTELRQSALAPDALAQALPDPALLLRLDGAGEAVALAALCPQAVGAAIEAQTLGKVLGAPAPERRPTATDALLVQGFVELVLSGFAELSADLRGLPAMDGYGYTARIPDMRLAAMAIEDSPHLHLSVTLDFAGGAKAGMLHFVLPTRRRSATAGEGAAQQGHHWAGALEKAVLGSPARLEAQLGALRLPLADITSFQVGQVVPLGRAALDSVIIRASDGRKLMTARLGRSGIMRAVRLRIGDGPAVPMPDLGPLAPADPPVSIRADPPPPLAATPEPPPGPDALDDLPSLAPMPGLDLPE